MGRMEKEVILNTFRHDERASSEASHPVPRDAEASEGALKAILTSLEDSKAEDMITIDISGKSALGDHMVVASGRSHRHVGAMADNLVRDMKKAGLGPARVEGLPHCDWVLIDAGDVIVHLFRPEVRSFYNIEKMWQADSYSERRGQA